jgi:hypothetical protein
MEASNLTVATTISEILMARTKKLELEPEQICDRILAFDPELCDSTFLFELQPVLPTPEQVILAGLSKCRRLCR